MDQAVIPKSVFLLPSQTLLPNLPRGQAWCGWIWANRCEPRGWMRVKFGSSPNREASCIFRICPFFLSPAGSEGLATVSHAKEANTLGDGRPPVWKETRVTKWHHGEDLPSTPMQAGPLGGRNFKALCWGVSMVGAQFILESDPMITLTSWDMMQIHRSCN